MFIFIGVTPPLCGYDPTSGRVSFDDLSAHDARSSPDVHTLIAGDANLRDSRGRPLVF
jgi:hypothetical protein